MVREKSERDRPQTMNKGKWPFSTVGEVGNANNAVGVNRERRIHKASMHRQE